MGELLGITGAIGSGKTAFAQFLGDTVENHAIYETASLVIEVANRFNQLLEAELNFDTATDDAELVNQVLVWMPDIISEHLHHETTWTHLAITPKDTHIHPELYEKLFYYLQQVATNHKLVEKTISTANKTDYRALLQWLGGYFVAKVSPTIWYDELFRRINLHESHRDLIIVGGLRYISDAATLHARAGRVLHLARAQTKQTEDITEAEIDKIEADITVANNGSLEDLQKLAEHIWNDIAAGKPKEHYSAA